MTFADHLINIGSNPVKLFIAPAGILAGYISSYIQSHLFRPENRSGIDFIVPLLCTEQSLVILDRQKRRRKKDRTPAPHHTFPQVFGRIHAEQFYDKTAVRLQLRVRHVILIHKLIHLQKMRHLEVKFQHIAAHRTVLVILQIILDRRPQSGERAHEGIDKLFDPISLALPF